MSDMIKRLREQADDEDKYAVEQDFWHGDILREAAAELEALRERLAEVERECGRLECAIMEATPDPGVTHGQFLEMARTLHEARRYAVARAEAAEEANKRLREALVRSERKMVDLYRAINPHANDGDGSRLADSDEDVVLARLVLASETAGGGE